MTPDETELAARRAALARMAAACPHCGRSLAGHGGTYAGSPKPAEADEPPSSDMREHLAAYSHDAAWSGWLRYQFSKGTFNDDGSWTMPAWAVERWTRQMNTRYADLPDMEKNSDREEADKMLQIIGLMDGG